jgi:N-acetylglutamate synthase-like GNAT family acetyltransferase
MSHSPSDSSITLRPATPADWNHVEALLEGEALPLAGAREHWADFIVAPANGAIAGCVGLERYGDAGLLRSLAVSPAARDRGLGRALVEACIARARAGGVRHLALLTTTAEAYFARLGFTRVERTAVPAAVFGSAEFRGACPSSAVAMVLDLRSER